ncbi:MAG: hypothetical protein FJ147_21855 [Deltaproteobacteria bacterium]|nr:hypothetical protein [Deltaproteobacteria bacterium]
MYWTVGRKITSGLALLVGISTVSLLVVYRGLSSVNIAMQELADIEQPITAAAYEMEINVNGMGLAVLKYLNAQDSLASEEVKRDEADFERFYADYVRLSRSQRAKDAGLAIGEKYAQFKTAGHALMQKRNDHAVLDEAVMEHVEAIDVIIDQQLQPLADRTRAQMFEKVEAILDLEAAIAEVALWLSNYRRRPQETTRQLIVKHSHEFSRTLSHLLTLQLTGGEQHWASL